MPSCHYRCSKRLALGEVFDSVGIKLKSLWAFFGDDY